MQLEKVLFKRKYYVFYYCPGKSTFFIALLAKFAVFELWIIVFDLNNESLLNLLAANNKRKTVLQSF